MYIYHHHYHAISTSYHLVIVRLVRIRKIKDNSTVRPPYTTFGKLRQKVNTAVEAQASIKQNINPLGLKVRGSVDSADIASLHEVISDEKVLLIRTDFDVVRADDTLVDIRVL